MASSISWNEQTSDYVIPSEKPNLNFVDKLLDHDEAYLHVKSQDHRGKNQISGRSFTKNLPATSYIWINTGQSFIQKSNPPIPNIWSLRVYLNYYKKFYNKKNIRKEFKSSEEQIFCKAYGKMEVSAP